MGLVYDEEPKFRAHCVMAGSTKFFFEDQGHSTVEGLCTIWTRKYPQGWEGISRSEAGDLVDYPSPISAMPNTNLKNTGTSEETVANSSIVWLYSTAVCVDVDGVEIRIECPVPKKMVEFEGVTYDLEPGWEDVVNALKKEFSAWAQYECTVQQQSLIQSRSPPKKSPQNPPKQNPNMSKKDQQSMHSLQNPSPLQRAVVQSTKQSPVLMVKTACTKKGDGLRYYIDQNSAIVHQDMGQHLDTRRTFQPGPCHGHVLQPRHTHDEGTSVDSFGSPSRGKATVHHAHAHISNETSDTVHVQPREARPPVQEKDKPKKRGRPPTKRKQIASKEEVENPSDQVSHAAEAESPPSTGKSGSKRKRSAGTRTPAKKRATAETSPASEVHEGGCETPEALQDSVPAQNVQFEPEITSVPLGELGIQQMIPNHPFQAHGLPGTAAEMSTITWNNYNGQITNPLFSSGFEWRGLVPYIQNGQNSMSGTHTGFCSSKLLPISQQLCLLDQHQAGLIDSFRNGNGGTEIQRIQYKLCELNAYRTHLLAMSSAIPINANQVQMYQPDNGYFQSSQDPRMSAIQWNNSLQQLSHHEWSTMPQNIDQQCNQLPIPSMQSNNGSRHDLFQMRGIKQNDDSLHSHSETSVLQLDNQSRQVSVLRSHLRKTSDGCKTPTAASGTESWETPEVGSFSKSGAFESGEQAATPLSTTSSISDVTTSFINAPQRVAQNQNISQFSNISHPASGHFSSTAQHSIAEYPQDSVENARGYVTSLLQTPIDQLLQTPWEEHQRIQRVVRQHNEEMMQQQLSPDFCANSQERNDPNLDEL